MAIQVILQGKQAQKSLPVHLKNQYYGKTLQGTTDLKTNCCCTNERPPQEVIDCLKLIHEDVLKIVLQDYE